MAGKRITPIPRKLRPNPTDAEKRLWGHLRARQLGVHFTSQFGIGNSIVDFACRPLKLVIELDGGQHSNGPTDENRTCAIEAHGYHVVRFWNHDVLTNTNGVLQRILEEIELARNRP